MDTPLVSILTPAYNAGATLALAVESVLQQKTADWELILYDDGSTDNTWSLMQQLAQEDARIRSFHSDVSHGPGAARMAALDKARGVWIALLDADDIWLPEKLTAQLAMASMHPEVGFLYSGVSFLTDKGQMSSYRFEPPARLTRRDLLRQNQIVCSSVLLRRELLERFPMPSDRAIHEDYALWLKILREEPCAFGLPHPLLIYRLGTQRRTSNKLLSARMHWNTLRADGVPLPRRIALMGSYTVRNLIKYARIYRK